MCSAWPFPPPSGRYSGRACCAGEDVAARPPEDFHLLAASHDTNAVYVFNPQPNSLIRQAALHCTLRRAEAWGLAVHPKDPQLVAAATAEGPYLSRDAGRRCERLVGGKQALALSFDLDGEHLWFSSYADQAQLWRIALKPGGQAASVPLPSMGEDAVAYLAQHPQRTGEIAIATFKLSVYLSPDRGGRWTQIAKEGVTR